MIATLKREAKYLSIYIAILFVFWLALGTKVDALKGQINTVVRVQCLSGNSAKTLGKYNDFVQTQIDANHAAEKLNLAAGDARKAALNAATAARLEGDKIDVPEQDCSKPLLP
jgi:hypothetical protein